MSEMTPEERAERVMMSNRYAGSMHEAIAELAQAIREAESAAYERAAAVLDKRLGTYVDIALVREAIRSLKSQSA